MSLLKNKKKQKEKQEEDLTKKRDEKCEPVAREIMQIIMRNNPSATEAGTEDKNVINKVYGPIATEIVVLMKDKGFSISESNYTWSIVQAIFDTIKSLAVETVQLGLEMAEQKVFSVDSMSDLTLQQIDNVLESK